jgi:putative SOS response-associated peptidase YedK
MGRAGRLAGLRTKKSVEVGCLHDDLPELQGAGVRYRDLMCGRFTLTTRDVHDVAHALAAEVDRERGKLYRPRWNVAPTDEHWIVCLDENRRRRLVPARFGFERPGGQLVINVRSETAARLPSFRDAFAGGRCLVPADGFYEWQGGRADRRPLWFHDPAGNLLTFAGLVTESRGALAFVILTTTANTLLRPIHDRMPVLLSPEGAVSWLARPDSGLLAPPPDGWLAAREVSARVNAVANDGPELLDPSPPPRQLKLV